MNFFQKYKPESEFFENILKLFSSTVVASAINFFALPIITRLYSKSDYGDYQLLYSVIIVFSMVASLKYEQAIVLPKKNKDANNLVFLSLLTLCLTTLVLSLAFTLFKQPVLKFIKAERLSHYLPHVITGIFFTGLLQIVRFVLIRQKEFTILAKNKIIQMGTNQGISIGWGTVSPSFSGLFWGYIGGIIVPILIVLRQKIISFIDVSWQETKNLAKQYRKFPLVNTASVFLNSLSLELPVFMFSFFYDESIIGLYALANRLIVIPINLIGTSVQQVYYQAASEAFNEDPKELMQVYIQTVKKLSVFGLIPVITIIILAPILVGIVYGESWSDSGYYMQILVVGIYFRFINSPIGATYAIINRQEIALILTAFSVMIRFIAMYLFHQTPTSMIWALAISTALYYAAYNFFIYLSIRKLTDRES